MAIYKGGKEIKGVYHNGRTIKGVYHQGRQVWGKEAEVLPVYGVQLEALTGEDALWLEYALEHGTVDMTVGGQVLRVAGDTTDLNAGRYDEGLLMWDSVALTTAQVAVNAYVEVHVVCEEQTVQADEKVFGQLEVVYPSRPMAIASYYYSEGVWRFSELHMVPGMAVVCNPLAWYANDSACRVVVAFGGNEVMRVEGADTALFPGKASAEMEIGTVVSGEGELTVTWKLYRGAKRYRVKSDGYVIHSYESTVHLLYPACDKTVRMRVTSLVL